MVTKNLSAFIHWLLIFAGTSAAVVVIDQFFKWLMLALTPSWSFSWLSIQVITNTGAGFGIFKNQTGILAVISALVSAAVMWHYPQIPKKMAPQLSFALFLGGALGNLVDRVFRGQVIDFIDLSFWPAFNIADAAITIGVIGILWVYWKEE